MTKKDSKTSTNKYDGLARFIGSSMAAFNAETLTLPADVAKVRLQVQKVGATGKPQFSGMLDCLTKTAKSEGPTALFKGLSPALLRQISYSSMSLVLYEPIRDTLVTPIELESGEIPFWKRLLAGGSAGGISIACMNPTEVLKTQMQTGQGKTKISMMDVIRRVHSRDGIAGFWAGVKPNVARTFLVQMSEIGVYDEAKHRVMPYTGGDNFYAHVSASFIAGVASATTSTPADVVKTRLMNSAGGAKEYNGMVDAFSQILKQEGAGAFYKGFVPILCRKVLWVTAFFLTYEQVRPLVNSQFE